MPFGRFRRPAKSPVEARQGFLDRPIFLVLVVSTLLIVVGFGVAYLIAV